MQNRRERDRRVFVGVLACIGWTGLLIQLWLFVLSQPFGLKGFLLAIGGFCSFFTQLTNLIVAGLLTTHALRDATRPLGRRLQSLSAAAVVYIVVTMVVYIALLRNTWDPKGWQLAANVLMHYVMPITYPLAWLTFDRPYRLPWRDAVGWLVYPLLFGVISVARGAVTGWYPYGFLDANAIGYGTVAVIMTALMVGFLILGAIVLLLDRRLHLPHEKISSELSHG